MNFLLELQNLRTPFWDKIMSLLTHLGSELIVIGVLCVLYWCINKRTAYKLCFSYFISGLAVQGLKIACRVERPWIRDSRLYPVEAAKDGATGYSFPSGHTQSATGLYATLGFHFKKWWFTLAGVAITALVMFTRMYLGCHTPADVLVSCAITTTVAFAVNYAFDHFSATKKTNIMVLALIEIISIGLACYTGYVVASGKSTPELAMDCFKSAGAGIGFGIGWYIEVTYINFDPKATKTIWGQILKLVVGVGVALLIKSGIKLINPDSIAINIIRYVLAVLWITALFPLLFKKFSKETK